MEGRNCFMCRADSYWRVCWKVYSIKAPIVLAKTCTSLRYLMVMMVSAHCRNARRLQIPSIWIIIAAIHNYYVDGIGIQGKSISPLTLQEVAYFGLKVKSALEHVAYSSHIRIEKTFPKVSLFYCRFQIFVSSKYSWCITLNVWSLGTPRQSLERGPWAPCFSSLWLSTHEVLNGAAVEHARRRSIQRLWVWRR